LTQSHSGGGGTWPTLSKGDGQPRFLAVILSTDPLPIDPGSWGYLATPVSQEHFDTLVAATDGSALVGIHRRRDRREEMVQTFDANADLADQAQAHLLRRGQPEWVTRGTYNIWATSAATSGCRSTTFCSRTTGGIRTRTRLTGTSARRSG
jgi:hypothetical protein